MLEGFPPQTDAGLAAALSSLRSLALARLPAATVAFIVAAVRHLVPFPPATAALHAVLSGKALRAADQTALAVGLLAAVHALAPSELLEHEHRAFEHAPAVLALLVAQAKAAEAAAVAAQAQAPATAAQGAGGPQAAPPPVVPEHAGSWASVALHDATQTHLRLREPVRVRLPGGGLSVDVHEREGKLLASPVEPSPASSFSVLGLLPGFTAAAESDRRAADAAARHPAEDLVPDEAISALLLCHPPPALQASVWVPPPRQGAAGAGAEAAAQAAAQSEAAETAALSVEAWWALATASAARSAPMLRVLSPLALKRLPAPALTRGADGLHRVFVGPEACSPKLMGAPLRR